MKRPTGLVLSAIVLGIEALFLLLFTVVIAVAGVILTRPQGPSIVPDIAIIGYLLISGFDAVLATWAIFTVIGIVRLRSWARYSILIIGGGMVAYGIFLAFGTASRAMIFKMPLPQSADPHRRTVIPVVIDILYDLLIVAVGVWWLIYFNLRAVREVFKAAPPATDSMLEV